MRFIDPNDQFIAGIDGGGTHTRLEIRNMQNQLVMRQEFGPFNINSIGAAAFEELGRQVLDACGDMRLCQRLCIGGAGFSNPLMRSILARQLVVAGFEGRWKLCGDQEIAMRGCMDGPGVALISGTGAICFAKNEAGETARSGGYGYLIDDGGSGYALGRDLLNMAVRAVDGRSRNQRLLQALYQRLNARTPEEIISYVYSPDTPKAAVAGLAALTLELAEKGDEDALQILRQGARELAQMVAAVQEKLSLQGCDIALLGGLIFSDNLYRQLLTEELRPLGNTVYPLHDALWGAAQMAWEL